MRRKFFTVEDHFEIIGRGLVIVGKKGVPIFKFKDRNAFNYYSTGRKEFKTKVGGIEMLSPPNFTFEAILLLQLTKEDVPTGSEVFLNEEN